MRAMGMALGAGLLLAGCAGATTPVDRAGEDGIPLDVTDQGIVRTEIQVGEHSKAYALQFDTGSAGIRIFADDYEGTIPEDAPETSIRFGDGTEFRGRAFTTTVTAGPHTAEVPVHIVEQVSCTDGAASTQCDDTADKVVQDEGIHGIFGVDVRPDDPYTANPLPYLSSKFNQYTVSFTEAGGSVEPGLMNSSELTFDLEAHPQTNAIDPPVGADSGGQITYWNPYVESCWAFEGEAASCRTSLFDSGTNSLDVPTDLPGSPTNEPGLLDGGTLAFYGASGVTPSGWSVESGRTASDLIIASEPNNVGFPSVIAGTPFWFDHSVSYDLVNGQIRIGAQQS